MRYGWPRRGKTTDERRALTDPISATLIRRDRAADSLPQVAILADDFTGAADAAGYFAALGLGVAVVAGAASAPGVDVVAFSSDSRDLTEDGAAECVRVIAEAIRRPTGAQTGHWVVKKIDSTLRGHPGAELAAAMAALNTEVALVAPAFPAQGRTTIGGCQLVHGRRLEETEFASADPRQDVPELFRRHVAPHPVWHVPLPAVRAGRDAVGAMLASKPGVFVADATTDEDLDVLARAAVDRRIHLLCGSAGLARALARASAVRPIAVHPRWPPTPSGPVLVVVGTLHPATARQVEEACARGATVVRAAGGDGGVGLDLSQHAWRQAADGLTQGVNVVLATSGGPASQPHRQFAEGLAAVARQLLEQAPVGGLVLTGGDTAAATMRAVGSSAVWLRGEVEPGIPWGRLWDGSFRGLPIITKAGGFGASDVLSRCIHHVRAAAAE